MIDTEMIRKAYSKMHDSELIAFTQKEGLQLTQKAFIILKQETRKHGLPTTTISDIEAKRIDESVDKIQSNLYKSQLKEYKSLYSSVFKQKHEDVPDEDIVRSIIEKGYDQSEAFRIIDSIPAISKKEIEEAESLKIVGVISMIIGAIALYNFADVELENLIIRFYLAVIPFVALLGGFLRLLTALSQANFHRQVLDNCISYAADATVEDLETKEEYR